MRSGIGRGVIEVLRPASRLVTPTRFVLAGRTSLAPGPRPLAPGPRSVAPGPRPLAPARMPASAAAAPACAPLGALRIEALAVGARRRLKRRNRARPVLHDAFERARATLVEIDPARHRFDSHLEVLHLDAESRRFEHEVVNQLVVQRFRLVVRVVQLRLDVQRLNHRVRIEEQLEDWLQHPPDEAEEWTARRVDRRVLEREIARRRGRFALPPVLLEQVRADAAGVEELLELHARQLADFLLRVVHAALFANARADLPHDLLDVNRVASDVEL